MKTEGAMSMSADGSASPPGDKQGLLPYLLGISRRWRAMLGFVAGVTLLAAIVSLVLPKWYKASTTLLLPKNQSLGSMGSISMLLRDFAPAVSAGRLPGGVGQLNYLAILNSRRAGEEMVRRFDLQSVYHVSRGSMELALEEFFSNFGIEVQEDGSIELHIYDRDSVKAAEMVNAMVEILNSIAIEIGTSEARSTRVFLEKRLEETKKELRSAEDKFRDYQEKRGFFIATEDEKASASAIGDLFARKVRLEVEAAILEQTAGRENAKFKQLTLERNELERKLATFPEIGVESLRLLRDVLIQQKILEFLVPMYEQAKFEENRDVPVVTVLDRGVPPERKARPKRVVIIVAAGFSAMIVAFFSVALLVRFELFRQEHPDRYKKLLSALFPRRRGQEE
jgi:tyrosine-protein kinase Etk/Wzc